MRVIIRWAYILPVMTCQGLFLMMIRMDNLLQLCLLSGGLFDGYHQLRHRWQLFRRAHMHTIIY
jgi:hypothetical protein